jgi:hypothetical protein
MTEATCVRLVLAAELRELRERHAATPASRTAERVRLARSIQRAENELDAFDRSRAEQIGGAR